MTQEDGSLPSSFELRSILGRAKLDLHAYEKTLTMAAARWDKASQAQRWDLMAVVSAAHADVLRHMHAASISLGLPYERVVDVEFEELL